MPSYHDKYRPGSFETVKGQDAACKMLQRVIDKGTSQAFLLDGPSGCGKTTLARIAAVYAGCERADIQDVDAATNSGVEDTRKLQEVMAYRPIGGGDKRAIVIDECHGLSQKAWDTLLKTIEEPHQHVMWFFCTTNVAKVPKTIKTRCTKVQLKLLSENELDEVIGRVIKKEKLDVSEAVRAVIVREAHGSAREALVNLASAEHCTTGKEAAKALHTVLESDPTRELCQFLLKPGSWPKAMAIVKRLGETPNYEGTRIVIMNYMGKVLQGASSDSAAANVLGILEAFAEPYSTSEGSGPFMLSLGRAILAE
jgi:DNA polymerase III gamma/tau subunit